MNVLVTGATGFVGRHLVAELERAGHSVTVALRNEKAAQHLPEPKSERSSLVVGELDGSTDWTRALRGIDAVVHLAARAHILDGAAAADDAAFRRVNVDGTARLAEQAVRGGARRFVLMSSIGAVTSSSEERIDRETPCAPDTAYGRSKLASERALIERTTGSAMEHVILRPTLVYGPGNPGNMARLIAFVGRGLPIPLGAIRNRRSFTFVGNLTSVVTSALSVPRAADRTYFVADGDDCSTPDLIRKIASITRSGARVVSAPMPLLRAMAYCGSALGRLPGIEAPLDIETLERLASSLYVDVQPLRDELGWIPPFRLDEGLRCMLSPS